MLSRVTFSTIAIHSVIMVSASTSNSDLTWLSEDKPLFSDTEMSSNQGFLPLDQSNSIFDLAQVPGDSEAVPSPSIFSDTDSGVFTSSKADHQGFNVISNDDDPLIPDDLDYLADCLTSKSFPALGISRLLRQRDGSGSCANPSTVPDPDEVARLVELFKDPAALKIFGEAVSGKEQNMNCRLITAGVYPWGVCSSGEMEDQVRLLDQVALPSGRRFFQWTLTDCSLGTYETAKVFSFREKFPSIFSSSSSSS